MPTDAERIRIFRSPLTDAQAAADAAFDRLRGRLAEANVPSTARGMDFRKWAAMARRAAPEEMAAVVEACEAVRRLMGEE